MAPKRQPKRRASKLGNQYAKKPSPKVSLTFRLSQGVKDSLQRAALEQGISASEWTEAAIVARLGEKKKAPPLPTLCGACGEEYRDESAYESDYGKCCAGPLERQP